MIKIEFICHGNICRSPMAEFVMKKIIKGGTIVTESAMITADILIDGEKISVIGQNFDGITDAEVIDAVGMLVLPGGVDAHVHLDFMRNAPDVAREAAELGLGLFGVTVTPDATSALHSASSTAIPKTVFLIAISPCLT